VYLGIDIGTSSVKAVLIDDSDDIVAQSAAPLQVNRPLPGYSEQNPEDWWQATLSTVRALPKTYRRAVRAVGLSGQMHGATLLDQHDRPLRPAILWNDGRSARECIELETHEPAARDITGNIVMPGFTAPKLLWVRKHEPEVFSRTAHVLLPKDYVRLRLTGEKLSDLSDASGTAWLDIGKRDWSDSMLEATGLTRGNMPGLVEGTAAAGTITAAAADQLGLPRGWPWRRRSG
jgi:xylulokinase